MSEPKHVAVDGRELLGQPTGVGRYVREIVRVWCTGDTFPHRLSIVVPETPAADLTSTFGSRVEWIVAPRGGRGTRWEQTQLPRALHLAYDAGDAAAEASPLAHALWMFVADIIAALVPVIPFALLPMNEARYVSLAATAAVLVVLGIGRAKIGKRRMLSTTLQTLGIAAAAGAAGVLVGSWFG